MARAALTALAAAATLALARSAGTGTDGDFCGDTGLGVNAALLDGITGRGSILEAGESVAKVRAEGRAGARRPAPPRLPFRAAPHIHTSSAPWALHAGRSRCWQPSRRAARQKGA